MSAPTPAARASVLLRLPGASAYQPVSAGTLDTNGTRFSGFADVTAAVREAGQGAYTVANVQSGTGGDRYGAWDLVVAYRDPTQPARNLTVFDGLATISQSTPEATLALSGFTTPPSGPVRSVVGLISSEGDRTSVGDSATLDSRDLFDALNPANNVFNSSISQLGVRFSAKVPDYVNQLGADANSFNADGYLANGATSAAIRLKTGGETYYPSVVFFTSDIYSPDIRPAKSVVDLNGGAPQRGDVLEYTVRLTNTGQDAATGLRFFDPVPAHASYVPGSLRVTAAVPGATCPVFSALGPTDAADGDQAEFDADANRAIYRVGTGATGDAAGRLDAGETACVRLRVTIDPDAPLGTQVVNQGAANYFGETLGTAFPDVLSNDAAVTVSGADLVPTKSHGGGAFVAGQSYDFTIGVRNVGDIPTDGSPVSVTDTFPAAGFSSVNSAAGAGWTCNVAAQTVTCTRSDALGPSASWPPIVANATVATPAPATIVNTAEVTGGGDVDSTNNSATDAGGATAQADLALTKVSDLTTTPARRDLTFTLEVTNRGPSTASAVRVTDTLAPDFAAQDVTSSRGTCSTAVVCDLGSLASGQAATITIVARVLDAAADSTATNTATVQDTGASVDPVPDNDIAQVDISVPPSSDLQVEKSVSPIPAQAGDPVTFTIPVTNAGPSVAQNVVVADAIPPELVFAPPPAGTFEGGTCVADVISRLIRCERAALAPGETATIVIQGTLTADSRGKTVLNSVQAISDSVDPQPELAKDTVAFVPVPAVDLELTKGAPDSARPGGLARFRLDVANHGPSSAPDVVVRDTLPAGLTFVSDTRGACSAQGAAVICQLGTLANGVAIDNWGIDVRVSPSLAGRTVRNAATVASEPPDPDLVPAELIPASNEDAADLAVEPTADLRVTKSVTPAKVAAGGTVTYAIHVTDGGPGAATGVRVRDAMPAGLSVRSVSATQGHCTTGAAVVCELGSLAAGAAADVRVTAAVATNRAGTTITNAATVAADEVDLDQADNRGTAPLSVVAAVKVITACKSRRHFVIRLKERRGRAIRSAKVFVHGKRVAVMRRRSDHRLVAVVDLRGLPKGTYHVVIKAHLRNGRRGRWVRSYRTCIGPLPPSNHLEDPRAL